VVCPVPQGAEHGRESVKHGQYEKKLVKLNRVQQGAKDFIADTGWSGGQALIEPSR